MTHVEAGSLSRSIRFLRDFDRVGSLSVPEVLVSVAIAILTWPVATANAATGIDASWIVALHLAARDGLQYGHEIVFTFGPLGFLNWPNPYIASTSVAALLFVGLIHFGACLVLLHLANQSLGLKKATLFVMLIAFTFPWIYGWRLFGVLLFAAVAAAVYRRAERPTGIPFAVAIGAMVGFAGLGKVNIAAVGFVIALIGVAATARRPSRSLVAYVVATGATFLVLWVATGQRLVDVPVYVQSGIELSVGYSQSMGAVDPTTEWTSGVALLATVVLVALFWQRTAPLPRVDKAILFALLAITIFAEYKAGFTRAGVGVAIYLATLLAIWPIVAPRTSSWAVASVPIAGILAAFVAISAVPLNLLVDPVTRASALQSQVTTAVFNRRDAARTTAASLRAQYALPPEALAMLFRRTVHIEPWESAAALAYPTLVWAPEPVFQSYAAFTPGLDRLNAEMLAGPDAPERILWITPPGQPLAIDGRGLWFDAPRAKVEMLCRYVPIGVGESWQVLGRVPNRCGTPTVVGTITTTAGVATSLPADLPQGIVTIRTTGVATDLLSRLQIAIDHGAAWSVSDGRSDLRIPLGTAAEPNVIGSSVDVGYTGALALPSPPGMVTIGPRAGAPGVGTPLAIEVGVIPLVGNP